MMLIDLGRNDVGRVSAPGTVRLTERMVIERYSHVMHLASNVRGRGAPGIRPADVVRAAFPAGTLSGAPKIRAMEIIEELEPARRGIYGGAVGYISYTGNMDFAIAIRTLVAKQDTIYVQAGAGIVADSVPAAEYKECVNKARAVVSAVEVARRALGRQRLMLLVIDNYDSFTYNLVQYLGELGQDVRVVRNDGIAAADVAGLAPSHIVISPGPCTPNEAGISLDVIKLYAGKIPILGVCLGHQSIGQAFGGKIVRAARVMHGKTSPIHPRRQGRVRRAAQPVRGDALPFAADRARQRARLPGGHRQDGGRGDHGRAPQDAARRGRAVPPRVVPDHRGQGPAAQLHREGRSAMSQRRKQTSWGSGRRWRAWSTGATCRPTRWRPWSARSWTARRRPRRSARCWRRCA